MTLALTALLAFSPFSRKQELEHLHTQVVQLEADKARLEGQLQACEDNLYDTIASAQLEEAHELVAALRIEEARALATMAHDSAIQSGTKRRASRLLTELEVVGKPAQPFVLEHWFNTPGSYAPVTLLVFWEEWCPHCVKELPELQAHYEELGPRGLQIIGLTRLTKTSTMETVDGFLEDREITFPVGKESGEMTDYHAVSGIPAAALVVDGAIAWRGHPARLDWDAMERLVAGERW